MTAGYNVHWKIYQAAHHGVPQLREILVYVAARRGEPLPPPSQPTHAALPLVVKSRNLPFYDSDAYTYSHSAYLSRNEETIRGAPHHPVTVNDAISDLPPFDWKYEHEGLLLYPLKPEEKDFLTKRRNELGIPARSSTKAATEREGKGRRGYHHPPKNWYQKAMREQNSINDKEEVGPSQHITKFFNAINVER